MKHCLQIAFAVVILGLLGANFGTDVAYIAGSPCIDYGNNQRGCNRDHRQHDPEIKLPRLARSVFSAPQTQQSPDTAKSKGPSVNQEGEDIWVVLQGASAPIVAFFTLVLMCVGYGQLRAIHRQADIAEKTVIPAERAYMFVERIVPLCHTDPDTGNLWWSFDVVWKNVGKTPTRNLRIYTSVFKDKSGIPRSFLFESTGEIPTTIAGPDSIVQGVPVHVDSALLIKRQKTELFIYIWGWARYYDVFQNTPEHVTKFCWRVDPFGDFIKTPDEKTNPILFKWHHFSRHNCADEDCEREGSAYPAPAALPSSLGQTSHDTPPLPEARS